MVAVGGYRPADGIIYFNGNHEHVVLDIRAKLLEQQRIQSRSAYRTVARNYGDVSLEMFAERSLIDYGGGNDARAISPSSNSPYNILSGTPLFIETMRNDVVDHVGLIRSGGAGTTFTMDTADVINKLHIGEIIEISGQSRTITNIVDAAGVSTITVNAAITTDIGDMVLQRGMDYRNPHLNEVYRVTDKYGSFNLDNERYQVDRINGIVRYRPSVGQNGLDMWHPEDDPTLGINNLRKPYYFGRQFTVSTLPPVAGDVAAGGEGLGIPVDPVTATDGPGVTTAFGFPTPNGEYSNIHLTVPPGMSYEVELNGAKLALGYNGTNANQTIIIPFFDPNHTNDYLKADRIDPDIYISRFVVEGVNNLAIRASRGQFDSDADGILDTDTDRGISVQGVFNGVDLDSGNSAVSNDATDWSVSQHSILGIAGKIDFDFGDRITMENVNDEIQKIQGALESLTTIIAATDVNQLDTILSVIR